MPSPVQDSMIQPDTAPVTVSLEPVHNLLHSLILLIRPGKLSGLGEWITRTASTFTSEEKKYFDLTLIGFFYAIFPEQSWPSFPAYITHLSSIDPAILRDKLLAAYARRPLRQETEGEEDEACKEFDGPPLPVDWDAVLKSSDSYLEFLRARFDPKSMDEEIEALAYTYLLDLPKMQALFVTQLQTMWDKYLRPEWTRVEPMLQDAVTAFGQIDFSTMSRLEAAQHITGRTLDPELWEPALEKTKNLIFVPSAHVGPYLPKFHAGDTLWLLFGARLPQGVQFHAPDLNRAEIVVRLNALADDTRLRILKLIAESGELRSQDIMQILDLSQSAASRHLKQLSATGYLIEQRRSGAKHYDLNPKRIQDTLQAISIFLLGN